MRMGKNSFLCISIVLFAISVTAQPLYPSKVEEILKQSKSNRHELEKVINHFQSKEDSLKLKAVYFLIANMDIHYADDYYWVDSSGKTIAFSELDYPDFKSSVKAFNDLKRTTSTLTAKQIKIKDIDSIKANFLIDNVDRAFVAWRLPWAKDISFNNFCEYLLPYRVSIEPLQKWRSIYADKFSFVNDSSHENFDSALLHLKNNVNNWFTCTYNLEKRTDPLPRLGSLQLLLRKKGPCEDVADMTVFSLRSQGIPASIDIVPFWATSTGSHTLNIAFDPKANPIPYDILLLYDSLKHFIREPAKVLRITYSKQKNTLPYFQTKEEDIPEGFLRLQNYIDVTSQYWPVNDVTCKLFTDTILPNIVYAGVFNGAKWQPAWWGIVKKDSVVFTNMCKGAVFLPMTYKNGRLKSVGYPVACGYNHTVILKPEKLTHTVHLEEQEHYLLYRPGKNYRLYYWDNNWKLVQGQKAGDKITELVFDNVPKNALLLLLPEYSQGKERPFMITDDNKRVWW
jgi:hypothetical protein